MVVVSFLFTAGLDAIQAGNEACLRSSNTPSPAPNSCFLVNYVQEVSTSMYSTASSCSPLRALCFLKKLLFEHSKP